MVVIVAVVVVVSVVVVTVVVVTVEVVVSVVVVPAEIVATMVVVEVTTVVVVVAMEVVVSMMVVMSAMEVVVVVVEVATVAVEVSMIVVSMAAAMASATVETAGTTSATIAGFGTGHTRSENNQGDQGAVGESLHCFVPLVLEGRSLCSSHPQERRCHGAVTKPAKNRPKFVLIWPPIDDFVSNRRIEKLFCVFLIVVRKRVLFPGRSSR